MGFLDTLKNLVPATTVSYVKNPNYDPNNADSSRFVDIGTAQQEAQKRADFNNDLFTVTGDRNKLVQPTQFFNPAQFNLGQPTSNIGAGLSLSPDGRLLQQPTQQPTQPGQPSAALQQPTQPPVPVTTPVTPGGVPTAAPGGVPGATGDIATLAAQAGLSVNEYQQLLADQSLISGERTEEIRNELGIPGLIDEAFKKPEQRSIDIYRELYGELGLSEIKDRIAGIDDTLNQRREDLVTAAGALKNNPWLSQSSRTGRLRILNELASADISNILSERQQVLDIYDDGVSEIERQVGFELSDVAEGRQLTVDQLNFMLGESERLQGVEERNLLTEGLRNVPDFLRAQADETRRLEGVDFTQKFGDDAPTITGDGDVTKLSPFTLEVYNNPGLLNTITATERGKVQKELANAGFSLERFTVEDLSAAGRSQVAQFDDLVRQGQELDILINEAKLDVGPVSSRVQAAGAAVGFGDTADFTNYRSIIDNMGSALLKLRSGAAVTPQEFERIKGFIPGLNDPEETAKIKIENFYKELEAARNNFVLRGTQSTQDIRTSVGIGTPGVVAPTAADDAYVNSLSL